jgi:hypothetical protein
MDVANPDSAKEGAGFFSRESLFPAVVAILVLLTVFAYRILGGAGFGFLPADATGKVPFGIVYNEHDNLMHLSWASQAAEGYWLFEDRYTLEEHPRAYFNPYLLLVGRIAAVLGTQPQAVFILFGLAAIPVVVIAGYWIARQVGLPIATARLACVFIAFASGITYPLEYLWSAFGDSFPFLGADKCYLDALFFPTFLIYPLIAVAYALTCLTILMALACDSPEITTKQRLGRLIALCLLTMLLGFTHPYEHAMLLAGYGVFLVWSLFVPASRPFVRRRLPIFVALGIGSSVVVGYFVWLSRQPVWDHVARASSSVPFDPIIWAFGYGTLLPLALMGAAACVLNPQTERANWLTSWMAVLLVLLIGLNINQTKVSAGGHLPLCILGAAGIAYFWQRVAALPARWQRLLGQAGLAVVVLSLFGSTVGLMADKFGKHFLIDTDLLAVARQIEVPPSLAEPRPRVLCDHEAADVLVPLFSVRVYCGNHYKTPDWFAKRDRQQWAGVEPSVHTSLEPDAERQALADLLRQEKIDYAILPYSHRALPPELAPIVRRGNWSLYRVLRRPGT